MPRAWSGSPNRRGRRAENFLQAFRAYSGYEDRGRERRWLLTIARNVALNHLNKRDRRCEVNLYGLGSNDQYLEDLILAQAPSAEEIALADELTRRVLAAIRNLPKSHRTTFYYRYIQNFSVHETAALTEQPPGSVKSKCHYAMQKVRRSLFSITWWRGSTSCLASKPTFACGSTLKMQSSPTTGPPWSVT